MRCDCEAHRCHLGNCPETTTVRVVAFGQRQNLCSLCFAKAKTRYPDNIELDKLDVGDHMKAIESLGGFGVTVWMEEDIITELNSRGITPTVELTDQIKNTYSVRHMADRQTGWECIYAAIAEVCE